MTIKTKDNKKTTIVTVSLPALPDGIEVSVSLEVNTRKNHKVKKGHIFSSYNYNKEYSIYNLIDKDADIDYFNQTSELMNFVADIIEINS